MGSVLSLSHLDMDGVSAQVVLSEAFNDVTVMNCGYDKVEEYLNIICDKLAHTNKYSYIFITDLHFTERDFTILSSIVDKHPNKMFIYIDHHDYEFDPTSFKKDNLKVIKSTQYSATKLTYGYIRKNFSLNDTNELRHLVDTVDAYDLWRTTDPLFNEGLIHNEIFWNIGVKRFYLRFKDSKVLRKSDYSKYEQWMDEKNKYFTRLQERGMLFTATNKSIFCGFIDEYRSHITLDFPEYLVHINVTRYGSISVRIGNALDNERAKHIKDRLVNWLVTLPQIHSAGGHIKAMGAKALNCSAEDLVSIGQQLTILVDEILEHELKLYSGTGEMSL